MSDLAGAKLFGDPVLSKRRELRTGQIPGI